MTTILEYIINRFVFMGAFYMLNGGNLAKVSHFNKY